MSTGQSCRKATGGYRLGGETPTKLRLPLASINNVRHVLPVSGTAVTPTFADNTWKPRPERAASWLDEPLVKTVRKPSLPPLKLTVRKCAPNHIDAENPTPIRSDESTVATRKHDSREAEHTRVRAQLQREARSQRAEIEEQERRVLALEIALVDAQARHAAELCSKSSQTDAMRTRFAALVAACRAEAMAAAAAAATAAARATVPPAPTPAANESTAILAPAPSAPALSLPPLPPPQRDALEVRIAEEGPLGAELGTLLLVRKGRVVVECVRIAPGSQLARLGVHDGDWLDAVGTRSLDLSSIFDPDGDGKVTECELAMALRAVRTTFGAEAFDANAPIENAAAAARRMMAQYDVDASGTLEPSELVVLLNEGECSFMYRYILRESCSQFDSLPLTSLASCSTKSC